MGRHRLLQRQLPAGQPTPARSVERCLRVHPVVELVDDHLDVALRLHIATHHPEWPDGHAAAGEECRDDGVVGPLAWRHAVGVGRVQAKSVTTVLERDAGARHADATAERQVVRLDHRDHHPLAVGRAEVDSAPFWRCAGTGSGGARTDERSPFRCVRLVQHSGHGDARVFWVGNVAVGVGKSELHRLHLVVVAFRRFTWPAREVEAFEDVERHQGRNSLAVRGHLPDLVAAVADADRIGPGACVRGQVSFRDVATGLLCETDDAFGHLT